MTRLTFALVATLAVLAVAAPARADIGVVVTGEATLQPQLAAQLESWLRDRGHTVRASPLDPAAINTLIDCFVLEDLSCAHRVVDQSAKTQTVVFARIDMQPNHTDGSRDISISGWWLAKGHEVVAERRACKHCTDKLIRTTADELMTALAAEPPVGTGPANGKPVATTSPGTEQQVPPLPPPAPSILDNKLLQYGLIGGGGALIIGGVIVIAAGNRVPAPTDTTDRYYYDYRPLGGVLAAVGVAAAAGGLYLMLRPHATSAPTAMVAPGGAAVGWAGRF